jgi:hypothetical protein
MRSQTTQQRQSPRFPQLRLAKIQPSGGGPTRFCLVTNMSDGGVRLHVLGAGIPNEFLLTLSGERPPMLAGTKRSGGSGLTWAPSAWRLLRMMSGPIKIVQSNF